MRTPYKEDNSDRLIIIIFTDVFKTLDSICIYYISNYIYVQLTAFEH